MTKASKSNRLTIPLQIPTYWTPEQAFAVFELIDELRDAIAAEASGDDLRDIARQQGMTTLRESGLKLIFDGQTTIDEVVRETVVEDVT